ncbi:Two pore calcium channel protein 1 [Platanthera guangdongensis]|uniref:Two pore calcium channel protein 1 n=1 Tax=Platanthera guangdongensis TaxID=2320717 RepID=A0ABR2M434_9ASPA
MDTPLISEASSSHGGDGPDGRRKRKPNQPFRRRSDAIAFGSRYQKAAALVDLFMIFDFWQYCNLLHTNTFMDEAFQGRFCEVRWNLEEGGLDALSQLLGGIMDGSED